jgi:hypothetical protein
MYKDRRKAKKSKAFNALLRRWSEVRILHGSKSDICYNMPLFYF